MSKPISIAVVRQRIEQGVSLTSLAPQLGICRQTLARRLRDHGVEYPRWPERPRRSFRKVTYAGVER